jgi:hypothetical protein
MTGPAQREGGMKTLQDLPTVTTSTGTIMRDMSTGVENALKCVIKVEEEALQTVQ